MPELDGRVALITGGARGFGRAIAHVLARDGADIAIADIAGELPSEKVHGLSTADDLERTRAEVEALGRRCLAIRANVASANDCERMASAVVAEFGKVDILAANAGVFSFGLSWELTEDDWDTVLSVNLKGVWLTTKYVVPHMIRQRYGKIVVTSSRGRVAGGAELRPLLCLEVRRDRLRQVARDRARSLRHQRQCHLPDPDG